MDNLNSTQQNTCHWQRPLVPLHNWSSAESNGDHVLDDEALFTDNALIWLWAPETSKMVTGREILTKAPRR